jgi:hypothetical protein
MNLLALALVADDLDDAVGTIQRALGIETGDLGN